MHASDETTGHLPTEISPVTHDTALSDEALDRAPGKGGIGFPVLNASIPVCGKDPVLRA